MPRSPSEEKCQLGMNTSCEWDSEARGLCGWQHKSAVIDKSGVEVDFSVAVHVAEEHRGNHGMVHRSVEYCLLLVALALYPDA